MKSDAPLLDRVHGVAHGAVAGDHDRDDGGIALPRGVDQLRAVHARQAEVGDDEIEGELVEQFERLFAAGGLHHFVAAIGQTFGGRPAQVSLVVDEQQMGFRVGHERQHFDTCVQI